MSVVVAVAVVAVVAAAVAAVAAVVVEDEEEAESEEFEGECDMVADETVKLELLGECDIVDKLLLLLLLGTRTDFEGSIEGRRDELREEEEEEADFVTASCKAVTQRSASVFVVAR